MLKLNKLKLISVLLGFLFVFTGCANMEPDNDSYFLQGTNDGEQAALLSANVHEIFPTGDPKKEKTASQIHLSFSKLIDRNKIKVQKVQYAHKVIFTFLGFSDQHEDKLKLDKDSFLKGVMISESQGNAQVSVTLEANYKYNMTVSGKDISLTFYAAEDEAKVAVAKPKLTDLRFHAKSSGGGDVVVSLTEMDNVLYDVIKGKNKLTIRFGDVTLAPLVHDKMDVSGSQSLIESMNFEKRGAHLDLNINTTGGYSYIIKKFNEKLIITFKPSTLTSMAEVSDRDEKFKGKPVSFQFQNIEVTALLKIISDFTGLNFVVSDSVKGSVSLNLKNVPWNQVLDIVLKSQALDMRRHGDVILIAPAAELAARDAQEMQTQRQLKALAPLYTEVIHLHYAKAKEMEELIKNSDSSLMSARGQINFDQRTNSIWIKDTAAQLEEIRNLFDRLDVPVKQILIEARLVSVKKDFERELGARFGITRDNSLTGTLDGANFGKLNGREAIPVADRLNFDGRAISKGISKGPASIGLALFKLDSRTALDLELSALESENLLKVISSPRLVTSNQQTASIERGQEIPYQQSTSSGATSIEFKKAVLSLAVTPRITPHNKIILDIKVTEDKRGERILENGEPAIDTQKVETQVLLNDGETVILGGVYTRDKDNKVDRVPFLGKIPLLGNLFKHRKNENNTFELLVFITPKIIEVHE